MYLFSQNQNATGTYEKMAAEKVGPEYLSLIAPKKLEIVFWNQLYYFALGIKKNHWPSSCGFPEVTSAYVRS